MCVNKQKYNHYTPYGWHTNRAFWNATDRIGDPGVPILDRLGAVWGPFGGQPCALAPQRSQTVEWPYLGPENPNCDCEGTIPH